MSERDPGWRGTLTAAALFLVPIAGPLMARRRLIGQTGLLTLRAIFVGLISALFLFWFVLSFLAPFGHVGLSGAPGRWALFVVALGVLGQALASVTLRKPLPHDSPEQVAAFYRARFFIAVGASESAALMAFVGVFITDALWVYPVGLAISLLGFSRVAPTRAKLEAIDRQLRADGAAFSIYDALAPPANR